MKKILDSSCSILVATFSPWKRGIRLSTNGNLEPLVDFLSKRIFELVLVDQVYPGSDFVIPRIEFYRRGKKVKSGRLSLWVYILYPLLWIFNTPGTHIVFKIRDFFSVIDVGIRRKKPFDYVIGLEAVNAIAGIMLRRLGKVKYVVYYVSDYSPRRYSNDLFNRLYLWLDRVASYNADFIWDVSFAMHPARIKAGLDRKKSAKVIIVPNALYPNQIKNIPFDKVEPCSLVFMGTLGYENGPDLAIEALSLVVKKFPQSVLYIIGGGSDLDRLQNLSDNLGLGSHVVFYGFISDREKISRIIRKYAIGLAPYRRIPGSPRYYGDATKIRAYLAAGLTVVTTDVPPLGKTVQEKGAGIVTGDDKKKLADVIVTLFSNPGLIIEMRKKAIFFARNNTWDNEFSKAFRTMKGLDERL